MGELPSGVYKDKETVVIPAGPGVGKGAEREAIAGYTIVAVAGELVAKEVKANEQLTKLQKESVQIGASLEAHFEETWNASQLHRKISSGKALTPAEKNWLEARKTTQVYLTPQQEAEATLKANQIVEEKDDILRQVIQNRGELPNQPITEHEGKLLAEYNRHLGDQERTGRQMMRIIGTAVTRDQLTAAELRRVKALEASFARSELDAIMAMGKLVAKLSDRFPARRDEFRARLSQINLTRKEAKKDIIKPIDKPVDAFTQMEAKAQASEFIEQANAPTEIQETLVGQTTKKESFPVSAQRTASQVIGRPISRQEIVSQGTLAERYTYAQRRATDLKTELEKLLTEHADNPQMAEAIYALAYRYNLASLSLRELEKQMGKIVGKGMAEHRKNVIKERERIEREEQAKKKRVEKQIEKEKNRRQGNRNVLADKLAKIRELVLRKNG